MHCPIYAVGTLNGVFKRVNTKRASWDVARIVAARWETQGSWEEPVAVVPLPVAPRRGSRAEHPEEVRAHQSEEPVVPRGKGFMLLEQWTPTCVRKFALTDEWTERNPARLVKNPRVRAGDDHRTRERLPFADEELKRMFDACNNDYGQCVGPGV